MTNSIPHDYVAFSLDGVLKRIPTGHHAAYERDIAQMLHVSGARPQRLRGHWIVRRDAFEKAFATFGAIRKAFAYGDRILVVRA